MSDIDVMMPLLKVLDNDIDAYGWDQAAQLFAIKETSDGDLYLKLIGKFELDLPISPIDRLYDFVDAYTEHNATFNEYGLAFTSEGWTYSEEMMDRIQNMTEEEMNDFYAMFRPAQLPDRREIRSIIAVTKEHGVVSGSKLRDDEDQKETQWHLGGGASGNIPDALKAVVNLGSNG
jgi:hypothetical protein